MVSAFGRSTLGLGYSIFLVDGVIVLVYFAGISAVGLYMGRREQSLSDFALGGRRIFTEGQLFQGLVVMK